MDMPPPPPPPMLTLSLPSVARATVQPPSTGPTTSSSGTNTSLKNTSLNSELPVVILSGPDLDALGVHVDRHHRDAVVLGHVGVGAHGGEAHAGHVGAGGPHLLAVDEPAAVDAGGLGLHARRVGAGVGLAEELAPRDLLVQRGPDPAVELVLVAVLDDREDVPRGDAVLGREIPASANSCSMTSCSIGAGLAPVGLGPVRHHVAGLDQPGALLLAGQALDALGERLHLGADGVGLGRELDGLGPRHAAPGEVDERLGGVVGARGSRAASWPGACRGGRRAPR